MIISGIIVQGCYAICRAEDMSMTISLVACGLRKDCEILVISYAKVGL